MNDVPTPATFGIQQVDNIAGAPPGAFTLVATYGAGEAAVQFLVEIDWAPIAAKIESGADLRTGFLSKGRFHHVAGADPKPLLAALGRQLGATAPKLSQTNADVLPFEIALLGGGLSRDAMGGFNGRPRGDWMATKLFLAGGEAEVYFNVEMETGEADFSPKDPAYGTAIVEELSKVLW